MSKTLDLAELRHQLRASAADWCRHSEGHPLYSESATTLTTKPPAQPGPGLVGLRDFLTELAVPLIDQHGRLLAVKDLQSQRYVHVNEAMEKFLGRPLEDVLGHGDAEVFEPALVTAMRAAEQTALGQGAALTSEHRFEWAGVRREFSVLRVVTPPNASGRRHLCSLWTDLAPERQRENQLRLALEQIEQQQRAMELLRREVSDQALRDPDSGLYRRAHFDDQLRREVDLSTREHREFSIVFISIDPPNAKVLALGDAGHRSVLEAVGRLLSSGTRAMDASCRHAERRFAVLLSGVGLATAHSRMEGLRRKCATQIVVHEGQELAFSVSMGVASFPHTALSQEGLLEACESALAEARRRGGNQVTLAAIQFDPGR